MRDVSHKVNTLRVAIAEARLRVTPTVIDIVKSGKAPKGDPFPVARVAAIQAAKNTPQIIPYCHSVPLDYVGIEFKIEGNEIVIEAEVKAIYKTGVEMEALTAVSAAALNLYDLLKPLEEEMEIVHARLTKKTGGKSDFVMPDTFRVAVVVVSDRAYSGEYQDKTGPALQEALEAQGGQITSLRIVPDVDVDIHEAVLDGAKHAQIVIAAGGTGLGPRDRTPQVIEGIVKERLPGIEDQLRAYSRDRIPTAMLSRLVAGRLHNELFIAIPGSPAAARDAVIALFPYLKHALHVMAGGGHE